MARCFLESINSHKNIYTNTSDVRNIDVAYSIPEAGTNDETGMLVIVAGYGGQLHSNVFTHMREEFPDKYNMIVVQCDYFGSKYMGSVIEKDALDYCRNHVVTNKQGLIIELGESVDCFNDMGIQQALDVVTSVLYVIQKIDVLNTNKIFLFGSSHGAYISYVANAICPFVFSHIIDVSSYLHPFFLKEPRLVLYNVPTLDSDAKNINVDIIAIYDYLIKNKVDLQYDSRLYDLRYLYSKFENQCNIISFHGDLDHMTSTKDKKEFIDSIPKTTLMIIDENSVDQDVFRSAEHALELDFFKFFELFMPIISKNIKVKNILTINDEVCIGDLLKISYKNVYPEVEFIAMNEH